MVDKRRGRTVYDIGDSGPAQNLVIRGGRVIDPANGIDDTLDVYVSDGKIAAVGTQAPDGFVAQREINADGHWVIPGLIDMHVHLREPGREDKETIESGTRAAAAGGFTGIACMPNTTPVLDEESKIRYVVQRGQSCPCRIYPIGAITKGLAGEELAPFGEMVRSGARGVSDDGRTVKRSDIMRNALNYAKTFDIPVICHCEDADLVKGGHMNEGPVSTRLGVYGMPSVAEDIIVARDVMLAGYTGSRVHIAHVSTAGAVRIIRDAKKRGVKVTAEACAHHFALTDEALAEYDTNKKMNPPLRSRRDVDAVIEGLADGTLEVISSDHAPHVPEEKMVEINEAAFGVIGLETSLAVALTHLVAHDILMPADLVERMSRAPARVLGVEGGTLGVGKPADITVVDSRPSWTVNVNEFFSKSRNSAFIGAQLQGYARWTVLGGRVVYERTED